MQLQRLVADVETQVRCQAFCHGAQHAFIAVILIQFPGGQDRNSGVPRVNTKSLFEFIVYGAKYVFPAKPGQLVRGIGTAFAAPVLENRVFSAGELLPVWPDARGKNKGLEIAPLFKTLGHAVRRDPELYALLALVDAIRIGSPREANLAKDLLKKHMEVSE